MATLCLSGSAIVKAGVNAAVVAPASYYDEFINQAEGVICAATRFNWIDVYGTLNTDVKYILEGVCSDLTAMKIISYDMSGFTTMREAETMLDMLRDSALRGISILRDKKSQTFIENA